MNTQRQALEINSLFGRPLVLQARATDPADLTITAAAMDAVHDAADELLAHAGNPMAQGRVIGSLKPETRLVLCMWVMDVALGKTLANRAVYAPMQVRG